MKKLLNTLYITNPDSYLSLDGENVVIKREDEVVGRIPLHNLEAIITLGYTGASPALMGACAKRNISLCFMTHYGKFISRVVGEYYGNVLLRKEQYRISDDLERSNDIAKNFITGKLYNSKWVIERAIRDHPMIVDIDKLKDKSNDLSQSLIRLRKVKSLEELRGVEGEAASQYFSIINDLILQQKEDFTFTTRNRRPPTDRINALLSFSYSLLMSMCSSALETVGLDPYVGFLHRDRPGRRSLALDLMEELRSVYADRFVLKLINKKMLKENDFLIKENSAVIMKDNARKEFLTYWQEKKQKNITHPYLGEKVEWGMIPYVQALLLARYIRGDIDEYPPFMWK